jgi:hypothetical protein
VSDAPGTAAPDAPCEADPGLFLPDAVTARDFYTEGGYGVPGVVSKKPLDTFEINDKE